MTTHFFFTASEFWVAIQRTEAATRCGLQGAYWLQVGREALLLKETQKKNVVHEWPYELLRRYGNDKVCAPHGHALKVLFLITCCMLLLNLSPQGGTIVPDCKEKQENSEFSLKSGLKPHSREVLELFLWSCFHSANRYCLQACA